MQYSYVPKVAVSAVTPLKSYPWPWKLEFKAWIKNVSNTVLGRCFMYREADKSFQFKCTDGYSYLGGDLNLPSNSSRHVCHGLAYGASLRDCFSLEHS